MESLLARALESKLKYWLKSFTREQFKLQGRTVQLCNLDINGEVLHSSIGLPPTLVVSQARVGRLEIKVPPFANVQIEPLVVEIDKLDLVLVEKSGSDTELLYNMSQGASVISKSNSYGFADKIADGMTLQVGTVNLMLETRGGTTGQEGAAWTPPLAAITIRNLLLYTTNECWQVVNLKEARDFSNNKKCIYVFKTLEWDSLSVDLLPHPDMFRDEGLTSSAMTQSKLDRDGAKRLFFGGERFLDNISGKAHITMHRTEQNNPLGLEVQLHIPEAVCSALSEPGLRALLRFMTGMYVCMNRGDVGPKTMQVGTEAAERTIVSATVDHIFICIKDADFQLELLVQSLQYSRSSLTNGDLTKTMAQIAIGGFLLRDTFQDPYTTLVQPGITSSSNQPFPRPNFASEKLWPRIYPLIDDQASSFFKAPLLCMYSIQTIPSPAPPNLASQTVVQCQPFKVNLQEESCLRIASFLVDGVVVDRGVVIPTTSVDSMYVTLKQLDLTLPVGVPKDNMEFQDVFVTTEFTGIRLHAEELIFVQSPSLTFKILELEKDPACFMLWQGQPIDASQRRWVMRAMNLSVSLEKGSHIDVSQIQTESNGPAGFWTCIGIAELCFEAAMVTGDGDPLVTVPPPRGIVRFGFHCAKLTSDTSVEQLFFVLRMYEHLGMVYESLLKVTKAAKRKKSEKVLQASSMEKLGSFGSILELAPSDTAVNLGLGLLELRFLESLSGKHDSQGPPLVQISGNKIDLKVSHRTLGGAIAVSSRLYWQDALVECVETDQVYASSSLCATDNDATWSSDFQSIPEWQTQSEQEVPMRPVFWTCNKDPESRTTTLDCPCTSTTEIYFLDINVVNVIPYRPEDAECHSLSVLAKICGVRLGGGMAFSEVLLHRFGILGPDGGPGKGLKRVLKDLSSGPVARLLKPAAQIVSDVAPADEKWQLASPDEIEINIQLQDWTFALQGCDGESDFRGTQGEGCWHSSFRCLHVTAQGVPTGMKDISNTVHRISVAIEGLEIIKPQSPASILARSLKPMTLSNGAHSGVRKELSEMMIFEDREPGHDGLNIEIVFCLRESETGTDMHMGQWAIDSMRAGMKKPVEVEATKAEVEYVIETVKVELEAASRIAAGLMQLLQLQGSIGHAAIEQLSSLGSGSLERLITAEKSGRRSSIGSVASMPVHSGNLPEKSNLDSDMMKLEQAVLNSKEMCAGLSKRFSEAGNCKEDATPSELTSLQQQLEAMQVLLDNIRKSI